MNAQNDNPVEQPYFIEVDNNGCPHCGATRSWVVIGPDGCALGITFGHEEDAEDLADNMNTAYWQGMNAAITKATGGAA